MLVWNDLPPELKPMIASHLADDGCPFAPLATISRSWAAAVEPRNFSRLRLTPARVPQLGGDDAAEPGNSAAPADEAVIAKGLWSLFDTLSTWEEPLDGGSGGRGLTLDISVYSPSDSRHWFKHASIAPDDLDGWNRTRTGIGSPPADPAAKRQVRDAIEQAALIAGDSDDEDDRAERHRHITHRLGYGLPQTAICRVFDAIRGGNMSGDEVAALLAEEELRRDDAGDGGGGGDAPGCDSDGDSGGSGCGIYKNRAERVFRNVAARMMGLRWIQRRAH
ncbi:hypothetical protein N3K66_005232 [Trichothecium roseum]|uniref:Uncharacterized protein n=1 Tax=Trichothecium roseum TaxID=47278 RepID=A0ACC0V3K4_9HYPO|nr:hypothetical protein N3K66_005232 [Trichothecium roseum]